MDANPICNCTFSLAFFFFFPDCHLLYVLKNILEFTRVFKKNKQLKRHKHNDTRTGSDSCCVGSERQRIAPFELYFAWDGPAVGLVPSRLVEEII